MERQQLEQLLNNFLMYPGPSTVDTLSEDIKLRFGPARNLFSLFPPLPLFGHNVQKKALALWLLLRVEDGYDPVYDLQRPWK